MDDAGERDVKGATQKTPRLPHPHRCLDEK
jgi:hypothetical protein